MQAICDDRQVHCGSSRWFMAYPIGHEYCCSLNDDCASEPRACHGGCGATSRRAKSRAAAGPWHWAANGQGRTHNIRWQGPPTAGGTVPPPTPPGQSNTTVPKVDGTNTYKPQNETWIWVLFGPQTPTFPSPPPPLSSPLVHSIAAPCSDLKAAFGTGLVCAAVAAPGGWSSGLDAANRWWPAPLGGGGGGAVCRRPPGAGGS